MRKKMKRILAFAMAMAMVISMPSVSSLAAEMPADDEKAIITEVAEPEAVSSEEVAAEEVISEEVVSVAETASEETVEFTFDGETGVLNIDTSALKDNDELYLDYVNRLFFNESSEQVYNAGKSLNDYEKIIYNSLKAQIEKVARGDEESTSLTVTPVELGGGSAEIPIENLGLSKDATTTEIKNKVEETILNYDLSKVIDALLFDLPFDFYWYDKTAGTGYSSPGYSLISRSGEKFVKISYGVTVSFPVISEYAGSKSYSVDTTKTGAAAATLANTNAIIEYAKQLTDEEKLLYYSEKIADRVSYNYDALAEDAPYDDAFQLIYVFDSNPNTNVVCEGYSKAFQYLCDNTVFKNKNMDVITVSGYMGEGEELGGHMWNIAHLDDNRNYIIDVTNLDTDRHDNPYNYDWTFFLNAATGSVEEGYVLDSIEPFVGSVKYEYDEETLALYSEEELTLSDEIYSGPAETREEYDFPNLEDQLIGDFISFPAVGHGYVENEDFPYGAEVEYRITNITEGTDDDENLTFIGYDSEYDEWFVECNALGHTSLNIFYDKYDGTPADEPYVIDFSIVDNRVDGWIWSEEDEYIFPGDSKTLYADCVKVFVDENGAIVRDDTSSIFARWELVDKENNGLISLVGFDEPNMVRVDAKDVALTENKEYDIIARFFEYDEHGFEKEVHCVKYTIILANSYLHAELEGFDTNVYPGYPVTVTPVVYEYSKNAAPQVVTKINEDGKSYDIETRIIVSPEDLDIVDNENGTYTLSRNRMCDTDIRIVFGITKNGRFEQIGENFIPLCGNTIFLEEDGREWGSVFEDEDVEYELFLNDLVPYSKDELTFEYKYYAINYDNNATYDLDVDISSGLSSSIKLNSEQLSKLLKAIYDANGYNNNNLLFEVWALKDDAPVAYGELSINIWEARYDYHWPLPDEMTILLGQSLWFERNFDVFAESSHYVEGENFPIYITGYSLSEDDIIEYDNELSDDNNYYFNTLALGEVELTYGYKPLEESGDPGKHTCKVKVVDELASVEILRGNQPQEMLFGSSITLEPRFVIDHVDGMHEEYPEDLADRYELQWTIIEGAQFASIEPVSGNPDAVTVTIADVSDNYYDVTVEVALSAIDKKTGELVGMATMPLFASKTMYVIEPTELSLSPNIPETINPELWLYQVGYAPKLLTEIKDYGRYYPVVFKIEYNNTDNLSVEELADNKLKLTRNTYDGFGFEIAAYMDYGEEDLRFVDSTYIWIPAIEANVEFIGLKDDNWTYVYSDEALDVGLDISGLDAFDLDELTFSYDYWFESETDGNVSIPSKYNDRFSIKGVHFSSEDMKDLYEKMDMYHANNIHVRLIVMKDSYQLAWREFNIDVRESRYEVRVYEDDPIVILLDGDVLLPKTYECFIVNAEYPYGFSNFYEYIDCYVEDTNIAHVVKDEMNYHLYGDAIGNTTLVFEYADPANPEDTLMQTINVVVSNVKDTVQTFDNGRPGGLHLPGDIIELNAVFTRDIYGEGAFQYPGCDSLNIEFEWEIFSGMENVAEYTIDGDKCTIKVADTLSSDEIRVNVFAKEIDPAGTHFCASDSRLFPLVEEIYAVEFEGWDGNSTKLKVGESITVKPMTVRYVAGEDPKQVTEWVTDERTYPIVYELQDYSSYSLDVVDNKDGTYTFTKTAPDSGYANFAAGYDLDGMLINIGVGCYLVDYTPNYEAKLAGAALSLKGDLTFKFYLVLEGEAAADDAVVRIGMDGKLDTYIPVSDIPDNYYRIVNYGLSAKEMAADITIEVILPDGRISQPITYSVMTYVDSYLKNPTDGGKAVSLMKSMVNYGASAQNYFGYMVDNPANQILPEADRVVPDCPDLSAYAFKAPAATNAIAYKGASLVLKDETIYRIYFTCDDELTVSDFAVTLDGKAVSASKLVCGSSASGQYIEIYGINPAFFDKNITIAVKDMVIDGLSIYSYIHTAMTSTKTKQELKDTLKALYYFGEEARKFNTKQ